MDVVAMIRWGYERCPRCWLLVCRCGETVKATVELLRIVSRGLR